MPVTDRELVDMAIEMKKRAYAPYSGFHVGAALLCSNGGVFTGCNVENGAYPAGICAERTAVVSAVAAGRREFAKIAVAGDGNDFCVPCGICRQFISEFSTDIVFLCADNKGDYKAFTLGELLPHSFTL